MTRKLTALQILLLIVPINCVKSQAATGMDYYNHLAKFLAGLGADEHSPFNKLTSGKAYKDYAAKMDEFWDRVKKIILKR